MPEMQIGYAVWVMYGFAIWVITAYAWDWWKNRQLRKKQPSGNEDNSDDGDAPAGEDATTTSAAA